MVVRHPFERLVSAYRDKLENGNKLWYYETRGEKMVKKYRPIPKDINKNRVSSFLIENL